MTWFNQQPQLPDEDARLVLVAGINTHEWASMSAWERDNLRRVYAAELVEVGA